MDRSIQIMENQMENQMEHEIETGANTGVTQKSKYTNDTYIGPQSL